VRHSDDVRRGTVRFRDREPGARACALYRHRPGHERPIGWAEFCVEYAPECDTTPSVPRDVVLSTRAWTELKRINIAVNTSVKPMTDMDHWGVVERWNYPDDGTAIARIMRCRSASS
jgi:predicted transglutaminase-like cysteine proteinase